MKIRLVLVLISILFGFVSCGQYTDEIPVEILNTIANKTTNKFVTLHMIAHSHDDPGFRKTFQEYFYGYSQKQSWGGVRYTLDTVLQQLVEDQDLKFTQIEMIFFAKWYQSLNQSKLETLHQLFKEGRFQIANGGWVMNDEACAYYEDIIDQMTLGHHFLKTTFDYAPTVGWHIDPFGQSMTQAQFFDQMGFDAWFFCRLDIQDHVQRLLLRQMQFVWHSFQNTSIFTAVPFWQYGPPPGYDFDIMANNNPIVDDPESPLYNLETKATKLVEYLKAVATRYRGSEVMYTFGGDFQYGDARITYENQQTLRKYINSNKDRYNINLVYSTPNDYIEALKKQDLAYPTNEYDFFPYRDLPYNWWTGFYTSRVALKSMIMDYGRYFQSVRNYLLFSTLNNQSKFNQQLIHAIEEMESSMGLCQHHDSVTGTCRQHVAFDYYRVLQRGFDLLNAYFFKDLQSVSQQQIGESGTTYHTCNWNYTGAECQILNSSFAQNKTVLLSYYNPANQNYTRVMQVKTTRDALKYKLIDQNNKLVYSEMICNNRTDANDCRVFFFAQLNELQMNYFKFVPTQNSSENVELILESDLPSHFTIQMGSAQLTGSARGENYQLIINKTVHNFTLDWKYYPASQANYSPSGIYVFRPDEDHLINPSNYSQVLSKHLYRGYIVTCITSWGEKIVSSLFLARNSTVLDIETFVDSINITDQQGKEIVLQVQTDIQNNQTFYTDSNGLNMIQRIAGYRPTFKLITEEKIASNLYPMTLGVKIQSANNPNNKLFLLTDRAQATTSLVEGQIMVLIHRRLLHDDSKGVQEPLNETNLWNDEGLVQRLRHQLVFTNDDNAIRNYQYFKDLQPLQYLSVSSSNTFPQTLNITKVYNLKTQTTPNIKIYLKHWDNQTYLLRAQNLNDNLPTTVDLSQFNIIEETTMTGNQNLQEWKNKKFNWKQKQPKSAPPENLEGEEQEEEDEQLGFRIIQKKNTSQEQKFSASTVDLAPLQIRTFKISNNIPQI